jgi:2-keto-4-pentenoate hydratase
MVECERDDLMPVTEEVIADLAHRLIAAERWCVPIEPITALYPNLTEADAYRVQMALVTTKVESGDEVGLVDWQKSRCDKPDHPTNPANR